MTTAAHDPACDTAHGGGPEPTEPPPLLVAVFASPVSAHLVAFARQLGWRTVLVEPDPARAEGLHGGVDRVVADPADLELADADVVVTDHDRHEIGTVLRAAIAGGARWTGVMGNPRHVGPHVAAMQGLGAGDEEIALVHRPIGLDIGSRRPPEIALSALAGLVADRAGRAGGFLDPVGQGQTSTDSPASSGA